MNLPPEMPISAEDWEKTPATVRAVVLLLWEENQALKGQVERILTAVMTLRQQNRDVLDYLAAAC